MLKVISKLLEKRVHFSKVVKISAKKNRIVNLVGKVGGGATPFTLPQFAKYLRSISSYNSFFFLRGLLDFLIKIVLQTFLLIVLPLWSLARDPQISRYRSEY